MFSKLNTELNQHLLRVLLPHDCSIIQNAHQKANYGLIASVFQPKN